MDALSNFSGKRILVCGMARSGQSAARLLTRLGANVTVQDLKQEIAWDYDPIQAGFTLMLGVDPVDLLVEGYALPYDLIIISPGISIYAPFVVRAKSIGIPVWGEAELAYRLCPCPIVAITGTNGKTTVTTLVGEILKRHNTGTTIAGNIGIPLTALVSDLTPKQLVVAEISSFQLETIAAFAPKISAVLNITPDHLDRHRTMENYITMKCRIFENQGQNDITVLNYDNIITRKMSPHSEIVYFSTEYLPDNEDSERNKIGVYVRDGQICSRLAVHNSEQIRLSLCHDNMHTASAIFSTEETIILPLSETKVMPENAAAATALALCAGVDIHAIADVLKGFQGVAHRLEYVDTIDGVEYYNDSKATNVDAAVKALAAFNGEVVLIAGGYDKGTDFAEWVALFPNKVAHLILIGQTAKQIASECDKINFSNYVLADNLQAAVFTAKKAAYSGRAVLFSPACASFDMFKDFEERGAIFKSLVNSSTAD